MGNMQEENAQSGTAKKILDSFVKGKYFRDGKEVEEKVYITDNDKLFVVDKLFIDKFYDLTEEVKRLRATSQGLQSQIMSGGLAKHYKVSSKKEAVEKYGDEIIEDYWKGHKKEIIERVLPEIDKDAIIQEYLQAHKKSPHCWDKANQKRTQDCAERTAVYLADFYGGKSTKEIAEKHNAVRGTVQRLLRVNDKNDVERLMQAYLSNQDLFGGTGEAELRSWLEAKLNKKTESLERKLAQARDFIAKNSFKVVTMPPATAQMIMKAVVFLLLVYILPICCILILETPVHYRTRCNAWRSRARKVISCRHPSCTNDWRF